MNRQKELGRYLDWLEYFTDEISRLNRALLAVQGGLPFGGALEEEVYIEDKFRRDRSYHALAIMIEHLLLLKVKFYTEDRVHGNWGKAVEICRRHVVYDTKWDMKEPDTALIGHLSNDIQDIYEMGVVRYRKVSELYPDRHDRPQTVPEHCPWSLEELINDMADELLKKLPNKK